MAMEAVQGDDAGTHNRGRFRAVTPVRLVGEGVGLSLCFARSVVGEGGDVTTN